MLFVIFSILLLVGELNIFESANVPLTMLSATEYPLARCLDGSQAGYYYQPATNKEDKNKWVIYLNGGGECDSKDSCIYQTGTSLGSSKYFKNTSDSSGWYIGSDYCAYNPDFCGWNKAFDPYCSQDLHAGQVSQPSESTWGLYFSGHYILEATLDALDRQEGNSLKDASDIILQGVSAGGIGVWMNVDYIAKRYPKARVTALSIAGFYFYATYYEGVNKTAPSGMGDFREGAFPATYNLYQAYVDEDCKTSFESKGLSPGGCMLANNTLTYIESDAFVVQAQTDQTVLTGHDNWPEAYMYESPEQEFMKTWSSNMSIGLQPLFQSHKIGRPRYGVFAAACYIHGGFTHSYPLIEDLSYNQAFGNFYFRRTNDEYYKLADDCGIMCNPTCKG